MYMCYFCVAKKIIVASFGEKPKNLVEQSIQFYLNFLF